MVRHLSPMLFTCVTSICWRWATSTDEKAWVSSLPSLGLHGIYFELLGVVTWIAGVDLVCMLGVATFGFAVCEACCIVVAALVAGVDLVCTLDMAMYETCPFGSKHKSVKALKHQCVNTWFSSRVSSPRVVLEAHYKAGSRCYTWRWCRKRQTRHQTRTERTEA